MLHRVESSGAIETTRRANNMSPGSTATRELRSLLRNMHAYNGTFQVSRTVRLLPMVMLRPGEVVGMEWSEWSTQAIR